MTLEQLRIFVEAARHQSFTVAAGALGLTQAAISISIKKLEDRHGVVLFDRANNALVLTEGGKTLLQEADRILRDVDLTVKRLETYKDARGRRLLVACSRNAYDNWMPHILSLASCSLPRQEFELVVGKTAEVAAWVMRGTVDIGISEGAPGHPQFRYWEVFTDTIVLCGTPARASTASRSPSWSEIEDLAPLLWERETDLEPYIVEALRAHKVHEKRLAHDQFKLHSASAVLSAVASGRYFGLVMQSAAQSMVASGQLTRVGDISIPVKYWMFAYLSRDTEDLASLIARTALCDIGVVSVPAETNE
jgi:DNA-binding transcriptional LysR family regulator